MTEEIEAHVLKKYEILQKLGKLLFLKQGYMITQERLYTQIISCNRQRSVWYCVEGYRQED